MKKYWVTREYGEVYQIITQDFEKANGVGSYYRVVADNLCLSEANTWCEVLNSERESNCSSDLNSYCVTIGDWSDDGHGKTEKFYISTNYGIEQIQEAYRKTCKTIQLQLNPPYDKDYIGALRTEGNEWKFLFGEYEDNTVDHRAALVLMSHGYDFSQHDVYMEDGKIDLNMLSFNAEDVFQMFMWFVEYSLPKDFTWQQEMSAIEEIVGYWGELNNSIGYGVFY